MPDIDTLNAMLDRRYSCRAFKPDAVPEEVLNQIVTTAGKTASWCNAQPWQVVITQGHATDAFRDGLKTTAQTTDPKPDFPWPAGYPGVYGDRRRTCGYQLYKAAGIARDDRAGRAAQSFRNFELFDAPHVAMIHSEAELGPYGALDCGGFVTAFMLAATSLGVATIAQASVAAYPDFIRNHFGLENNRLVLCAISLGYEDADHPANAFRTERADMSEILDLRR
ncbi:MAG: nitroreductase [Pseudomonadota bacterium]